MLATTVTTKMIRAMARKEGFQFEDTLTGFKWLGNRALDLQAAGKTVLLTVEEAIGFCVGDVVVDKDGVSAAAVFAEMACDLAAKGVTVTEHMHQLYEVRWRFDRRGGECGVSFYSPLLWFVAAVWSLHDEQPIRVRRRPSRDGPYLPAPPE